MSTQDGGPAFPCPQYWTVDKERNGMTLRDYFAAMTLQGIKFENANLAVGDQLSDAAVLAAKVAYLIADAMLKERAK